MLAKVLLVLATASLATVTGSSPVSGPENAAVLDVILLPLTHVCKCNATLAFSPTNGMVMCPPPNQSQIGCQIVWEDTDPTKGECDELHEPERCATQTGAKCSADLPELTLNLMNCWANGIYMTATGLQNGQRFFHQDDDGVSFDPNLQSDCKASGGSTTNVYTITFYPDTTGNQIGEFRITLTCANCTKQ